MANKNKRTIFGMAALAAIAVTLLFRGCDAYLQYREEERQAELKIAKQREEMRQENCLKIGRLLGAPPSYEPRAEYNWTFKNHKTGEFEAQYKCNTYGAVFYAMETEDPTFENLHGIIAKAVRSLESNREYKFKKSSNWCSTGK